ncbi:DUF6482 family protein [Colwellia sp. 12G3]|uniref:DUF6482 family protein n=1 Tax=Colwellia sp. 12G3 TaxID=2058299 RepID=UPI000C34B9FD|nr:DUF6482 family protein [Colwellia sp. 12G3]PKI17331.1 hypothetical protein CXF71_05000 [Colwellia sp. 12G3]
MSDRPTILGIADSTHYLVGGTDLKNDFNALPALGDVAICHSLSAAKTLLKEHNIFSAQLTLQTAYDEMCGLPPSSATNETIHF